MTDPLEWAAAALQGIALAAAIRASAAAYPIALGSAAAFRLMKQGAR